MWILRRLNNNSAILKITLILALIDLNQALKSASSKLYLSCLYFRSINSSLDSHLRKRILLQNELKRRYARYASDIYDYLNTIWRSIVYCIIELIILNFRSL